MFQPPFSFSLPFCPTFSTIFPARVQSSKSRASIMAGESATNAGDSFIGSFISLISKYEIRYEGILYHINVQDSTIGLKNVRSYGTEGRKKDGLQVPPSDKVYEYILFRGSDIKDLQVKSSPPAPKEQIRNDPAIVQTQYAGVPASSSPLTPVAGKNSLTESTQWQDTPALTSRGYPSTVPSNQSVTQQSEHSTVAQTIMYQQGYNGASVGTSHPPQHHVNVQPSSVMSNRSTIQPFMRAPEIQASMTLKSVNTSEFRIPVSSPSTSASVNPKFSPSFSPVQYSASLDVPSLSTQASLPSHSTSLTASMLITGSTPSCRQDLTINESHIVHKAVSDSTPVLSIQSVPYPTSPFMGSNFSPLLTPPPSLLTPDQSAHSGSYMLSSTQKLYPNQKDVGAVAPMQATSSSIPAPVTQAPLLPFPTSAQKPAQFTEEFDFMAMNEKFKKDDLWGYLGKGKQMDKAEGAQDSIAGHRVEEKEGHSSLSNQKPAYKKDDFFDSISCNAQTRGTRNGQNRFSERIKLDTETFGFQQRPNPGYGGYGAGGRGENFRGSHNWGRGYGYGGRGRGGNLLF